LSFLLIAIALTVAIQAYLLFTRKHIWFDLVDETKKAVREAKADLHQKEWEARNPVGPPLSESERAEVWNAYHSLARPALVLRPDPAAGVEAAAARLGGPAWLAGDEHWPLDAQGKRLEFVAQIDFGRLLPLEGFPAACMARFFVAADDLWGADFDHPDRSHIAVLWHEGPRSSGRLEEPLPLTDDDYSPFQDLAVREVGLPLHAEPTSDLPDPYSWQAQALTDGLGRRPGVDALEDELFTLAEEREQAHKIGGHPSFTQYDFRDEGPNREFDVLLLGLTSDDSIMWGDVGEASFMIRADDLARRDFSRVAFYWDCH
jgi:uncharacterized protein YwqG